MIRQKFIRGLAGWIVFGSFWLCVNPTDVAAMGEVGTITFPVGANGALSAAIDSNHTFAYFGTQTGLAIKIRLSDFTNQGTLILSGIEITSVIVDSASAFAYFGSSETFPSLTQVKLSNFTVSNTLFLGATGGLSSVVNVSSASFAYFGTMASPGQVLKINLSTFNEDASLTLQAGENQLTSAVIDQVNSIAYYGTDTSPGRVIKVDLNSFTRVAALTLHNGEDFLTSAVISTTTGFAYFGTRTSPGKIIQIRLSDFTEQHTLTLQPGEDSLTSATVDPASSVALFGTDTSPGKIVRIVLSNLIENFTTTLTAGEDSIKSAVIDFPKLYAYFGSNVSPGEVIKFDLLDTRTGPPLILTQPSGQIVPRGSMATFSVTAAGSTPFTYQWQENGVAIPGATSASYTTPALTFDDDAAAFTCVVTNSLGSTTTRAAILTVMPVVRVYPDPWRSDLYAGHDLTFDGLAPNSTLKIFTLSLHWVTTLTGSNLIAWPMTNDTGQKVASGYYFYLVTTHDANQTVHGKFAIIK